VAGTGAWADVFTKTAFAMPVADAIALLEQRSLAASITAADGQRHVTTAWKEFVR
jgi:hypothetical protein